MSTLREAEERLANAWHLLQQRWIVTRSQWDDPVAENFQRVYVEHFERETRATLDAMKQLAQVIAGAEREVH